MEEVRNGVLWRLLLPKLGDSIRLSVLGLDTEAVTHFPGLPESDFSARLHGHIRSPFSWVMNVPSPNEHFNYFPFQIMSLPFVYSDMIQLTLANVSESWYFRGPNIPLARETGDIWLPKYNNTTKNHFMHYYAMKLNLSNIQQIRWHQKNPAPSNPHTNQRVDSRARTCSH